MTDRYNNAVVQLAKIREQLQSIEKNYTSEQISGFRDEESEWLRKVVIIAEHENLDNPYELQGGGGKCTRCSISTHSH